MVAGRSTIHGGEQAQQTQLHRPLNIRPPTDQSKRCTPCQPTTLFDLTDPVSVVREGAVQFLASLNVGSLCLICCGLEKKPTIVVQQNTCHATHHNDKVPHAQQYRLPSLRRLIRTGLHDPCLSGLQQLASNPRDWQVLQPDDDDRCCALRRHLHLHCARRSEETETRSHGTR